MHNDTQPPALIGLFGGTFDPIHIGHLSAAWQVLQACPEMESIQFIPNQTPPHKTSGLTAANHRAAMVACAIASTPSFELNRIELERPGPSYSVDTIETLRAKQHQAHMCLIIGEDATLQFKTWKAWQHILSMVHLIVVARPVNDQSTKPISTPLGEPVASSQWLLNKPSGLQLTLSVPRVAISATEIRANLQQNKLPRFLIPEAVINYIQEHQLYKPSRGE